MADTREAALAQIAATTAICQRMRNEPTMPEADLQLSVASAAGLAAGTALLGTRRRARRATLGRCEPRRRAPPTALPRLLSADWRRAHSSFWPDRPA